MIAFVSVLSFHLTIRPVATLAILATNSIHLQHCISCWIESLVGLVFSYDSHTLAPTAAGRWWKRLLQISGRGAGS